MLTTWLRWTGHNHVTRTSYYCRSFSMLRHLLASAMLTLVVLTSASAEDEVSRPGPVPLFFLVTAVNDAGLVIEHLPVPTKDIYNKEEYKPAFKGLDATDAKGKKLGADELATRLKPGTVVLVNLDDDKRPL